MAYLTLKEIIDTDGVLDPERLQTIDQIIQSLLITRQGTVPGSRSFGLPGMFLDAPSHDAINLITVDLAEQFAKYAPEVQITKVEPTTTGTDGMLGLKIYLGGA